MKKPYLIGIAAAVVLVVAAFLVLKNNHAPTAPGGAASSTPSGTGQTTETPPSDSTHEILTLGVGQSKSSGGLTITLLRVFQDSRCPVGVTCIQAGTVNTRFSLTTANATETRTMLMNAVPYQFGNYKLSIADVEPPRQTQKQIATSSYQISFRVDFLNLPAGAVNLRGSIQCLPHRNPDQPHTQECAFGLQDGQGRYYALQTTGQAQQMAVNGLFRSTVIVKGALMPGESAAYPIVGTIKIASITAAK